MADLFKRLVEYSESDYYPFHMPGHKRNMEGVNPFCIDITEIDGFDNLHEPQGILRIAMEDAAKFYESDKTYFLVNGSTCGLLSAISGVVSRGDEVLVARNCHKAVYNAMYLNDLKPTYLMPGYMSEYDICGGIRAEDVWQALENNKNIRAVIITSPTYEGIVSDVAAISQICHGKKIPLIVDEAHGAHFSMHPNLPKSALQLGADIVIQSLHKTLPSLTQTALLHVKSNIVDVKRVERFLKIYQTSSPSYVFMASIDECINKIKREGFMLFEPYMKRLEVIMKHSKEFTHLGLLDDSIIGREGVFARDPSKLVILSKNSGFSGKKIYDKLNERDHIQLEMASGNYAIAMTSIMDTEEGLLKLFTALAEVDRDARVEKMDYSFGRFDLNGNGNGTGIRRGGIGKERGNQSGIGFVNESGNQSGIDVGENQESFKIAAPVVLHGMAKVYDLESQEVELIKAAGRISQEYVYLYPPGIPIIAPGEMVSAEAIELIKNYQKNGLSLHGMEDLDGRKLKVVVEDFKTINLVTGPPLTVIGS